MELIDSDKLDSNSNNKNFFIKKFTLPLYIWFLDFEGKLISSEIYAIHAIPLKDKSVQLGMINAPIFDLSGEIEAPWIDSKNEIIIENPISIESLNIQANNDTNITTATTIATVDVHEVDSQPPGKKMKMIQKTRSFIHDGYQKVETYNELVPCDDDNEEMETKAHTAAEAIIPAPTPATQTQAQPKSKQSSMMNFFKKK